MENRAPIVSLLAFLVIVVTSNIRSAISTPTYMAEIDPRLENLAPGVESNIMVTMTNRTDAVLAQIAGQQFPSRGDRLNALHDALVAHASLTQAPVFATLTRLAAPSIKITSFWISNQVFVKAATSPVITALSLLQSVVKIEPEVFVPLIAPVNMGKIGSPSRAVHHKPPSPMYNIAKIQAPEVWRAGNTGQGILVANIDTGVKVDHPAFADRFVGAPFGWYDPYLEADYVNPSSSIAIAIASLNYSSSQEGEHAEDEYVPSDQNGHGTHTMGILTGSGGIGVAPGAKWAACRGCSGSTCSFSALVACGQYFACPWDANPRSRTYKRKDCGQAPHVISCSWGTPGGNDSSYNDVVNAWNHGGITGVFAAGNDGPNCGTLASPGDQPHLIGVGATDVNDKLAEYSSVGPPLTPLPGRKPKPDIVAPGSNVISAFYLPGVLYISLSGTSMATPHVAGVVALMKSKNKNKHKHKELSFDQIWKALRENTDKHTLVGAGQTCGGKSDSDWPNYSFGYGRVNAWKAVRAV